MGVVNPCLIAEYITIIPARRSYICSGCDEMMIDLHQQVCSGSENDRIIRTLLRPLDITLVKESIRCL